MAKTVSPIGRPPTIGGYASPWGMGLILIAIVDFLFAWGFVVLPYRGFLRYQPTFPPIGKTFHILYGTLDIATPVLCVVGGCLLIAMRFPPSWYRPRPIFATVVHQLLFWCVATRAFALFGLSQVIDTHYLRSMMAFGIGLDGILFGIVALPVRWMWRYLPYGERILKQHDL